MHAIIRCWPVCMHAILWPGGSFKIGDGSLFSLTCTLACMRLCGAHQLGIVLVMHHASSSVAVGQCGGRAALLVGCAAVAQHRGSVAYRGGWAAWQLSGTCSQPMLTEYVGVRVPTVGMVGTAPCRSPSMACPRPPSPGTVAVPI
eukprot:366090-Chlamydomonas_euryale.AAC.4